VKQDSSGSAAFLNKLFAKDTVKFKASALRLGLFDSIFIEKLAKIYSLVLENASIPLKCGEIINPFIFNKQLLNFVRYVSF
jgi:hypothetical protein